MTSKWVYYFRRWIKIYFKSSQISGVGNKSQKLLIVECNNWLFRQTCQQFDEWLHTKLQVRKGTETGLQADGTHRTVCEEGEGVWRTRPRGVPNRRPLRGAEPPPGRHLPTVARQKGKIYCYNVFTSSLDCNVRVTMVTLHLSWLHYIVTMVT